jgi:hypothetical protein
MKKGKLTKSEQKWHVVCVEENDWNTYYPVNDNHKLWLLIHGEENMEACFNLNEEKQALLVSCESKPRIYSQD